MTAKDLSTLRATLDWICERHPLQAQRLAQAITMLELSAELEARATRLVETLAPVLSADRDGKLGQAGADV